MQNQIINVLLAPRKIFLRSWKALGTGSFQTKLEYDLFDRPHYAYSLYSAARLASRLGHKRISALEFGVAGGQGLLILEQYAALIEREFPVKIDLYGFDTGEGLPDPVDYRDIPYVWQGGHYKMDQDALKSRLTRANLVLGDVKDTVPEFCEQYKPAPIGAVFHDLDFWSSTRDALELFKTDDKWLLPRIYCYFDDLFGADGAAVQCEDVGQMLAIRNYNEENDRKIRPIAGLPLMRAIPAAWNHKIYVHHTFDHPEYTTYIHPDADRQLKL